MIYLSLPEETFPYLFKDAALSGLFPDGKFLADAVPLFPTFDINNRYEILKTTTDFDLLKFIKEHFHFDEPRAVDFLTNKDHSVVKHIETLWPFLIREADVEVHGSSLIPLPHRYVVPGGRFNEIYYWDSYFTMLGLRVAGEFDLIESMIDNFSYLIDNIGFIPNGNRSYFLSRSQPPFFAMMVELLVEIKGNHIYEKYFKALLMEYNFWMEGTEEATVNRKSHHHVVFLSENHYLNRYWDQLATPRSEMYRDDIQLLRETTRAEDSLFSDLRAACESGWDFSSRWCHSHHELATIETTSILPIDLNCLLFQLEQTLSNAYTETNQKDIAQQFTNKANLRKALIQSYFWDDEKGYYFDYQFVDKQQTSAITAAGIFPLVFGIADTVQANQCLVFLKKHLLSEGGILTTNIDSGQQWDSPNGWAPMQWMSFKAALRSDDTELAHEIVLRWTKLIESTFDKTGKLMEKYNVIDTSLESGGGEYPVQDGFGWTNGVYLAMFDWLKKR